MKATIVRNKFQGIDWYCDNCNACLTDQPGFVDLGHAQIAVILIRLTKKKSDIIQIILQKLVTLQFFVMTKNVLIIFSMRVIEW